MIYIYIFFSLCLIGKSMSILQMRKLREVTLPLALYLVWQLGSRVYGLKNRTVFPLTIYDGIDFIPLKLIRFLL